MNPNSHFDIKIAEQIIDEAIMDNKPHYLIKWKYLPHQYDTWESIDNLSSIAYMLQEWIRIKRNYQKNEMFTNPSSYCDTVNYVDPRRTLKRKRRNMPKKKPKQIFQGEIVIDDDDERPKIIQKPNKKREDSFINDAAQSLTEQSHSGQCWQGDQSQDEMAYIQNEEENQKLQKNYAPIKFDPEMQSEDAVQNENHTKSQQEIKPGMKVVGKIRAQSVERLIDRFQFKGDWCFRIELKDGKITNMREQDLKKLCPQRLMEFYEQNEIQM